MPVVGLGLRNQLEVLLGVLDDHGEEVHLEAEGFQVGHLGSGSIFLDFQSECSDVDAFEVGEEERFVVDKLLDIVFN